MPASKLQCWLIACLMIVRALLGAHAHAGAHETHGLQSTPVELAQEAAPCPDHMQEEHGVALEHAAPGLTDEHGASHGPECCQGEVCECVCTHVPAYIAMADAFETTPPDRGVVRSGATPDESLRPPALFRPPA